MLLLPSLVLTAAAGIKPLGKNGELARPLLLLPLPQALLLVRQVLATASCPPRLGSSWGRCLQIVDKQSEAKGQCSGSDGRSGELWACDRPPATCMAVTVGGQGPPAGVCVFGGARWARLGMWTWKQGFSQRSAHGLGATTTLCTLAAWRVQRVCVRVCVCVCECVSA